VARATTSMTFPPPTTAAVTTRRLQSRAIRWWCLWRAVRDQRRPRLRPGDGENRRGVRLGFRSYEPVWW